MSPAPITPVTAPRSEIAEHWTLPLAAAAGVMVSFASVFIYSFGVLLKPLAAEFGWARGQVSVRFSIAALTIALASPFIGRLADRAGVRPVVAITSAAFGLTFASLALLTGSLWQLYLTLFLIGCVGNGATQLTWGRAITSRFDRQRGLALALMMAGGGLGSVLVPLVTAWLVGAFGWRWAYASLGGLVLLAGPALALAALRSGRGSRQSHNLKTTAARDAFRDPAYRLLLAAFFLVSVGANGCVAHLVALLTDRGVAVSTAAMATSLLGFASVVGRLLTGVLIDRLFAPRVGFGFVAASAGGILLLLVTRDGATAALAAILIGLAMGAEADVVPFLISRYRGVEGFAELYGYAFSAYAVGGATGPVLMGLVHDRMGSYDVPLLVGAGATLLAAGLLLRLPPYLDSPR
jgi:predicted MFS family arabinose efflux permease